MFDREKTGFEETKEFPIVIGSLVAGRYLVQAYLGSAAFSKAVQVVHSRAFARPTTWCHSRRYA